MPVAENSLEKKNRCTLVKSNCCQEHVISNATNGSLKDMGNQNYLFKFMHRVGLTLRDREGERKKGGAGTMLLVNNSFFELLFPRAFVLCSFFLL